jgi:DNA-3-methyladenine glycosylase I
MSLWGVSLSGRLLFLSEGKYALVDSVPQIVRCTWASNPLNSAYHDEEWGVPVHDDRVWFEFLILEGAQAGLSWDTILQKRNRYRELLSGFDPAKVARYDGRKVRSLLRDPGIVRNRLKIQSTVANAKAFLRIQNEFGSFDSFIWNFVGGAPLQNRWSHHKQVPAKTDLSIQLSKEFLRRGFRFVGPTICYAFMQATGLVNDHLTTCFRYNEVAAAPAPRRRK